MADVTWRSPSVLHSRTGACWRISRSRFSLREELKDLDSRRIAELAADDEDVEVLPHRQLQGLPPRGGRADEAAAPREGGDAEDLVFLVSVDHEDGERGGTARPRDLRAGRL